MASKEYEAILGTHETYQNLNSRWRYLLNSFLGGEIYRQGQYLTRYLYESEQDYITRIQTTPLDNHARGVLSVYNAFLFRREPNRIFNSLENDPALQDFLENADLEHRSFNTFMKDISTYSGVFGHCWVIVTKPDVGALTKFDEGTMGVRPYVSLLTPLSVLDWEWTRSPSGNYYLTYFKYIEDSDRAHITTVKEWYEDRIITTTVNTNDKVIQGDVVVEPNQLGVIPAIIAYGQRSPRRGIGISEIDDIADIQRAIYNEYSEVEQMIRISGHPSLVKTPDTEAVAGAGAVVQMPDNLDPGLKPYLLQPTGTGVGSIYDSIKHRVEAIDRIANLGSARASRSQGGSAMSSVAMETEFQMLNARLSDKADNLELTEEHIWFHFCQYQGITWDGVIQYPDSFNIQDKKNELDALINSRKTVANTDYQMMLDHEIMEQALGEEDFENYLDNPDQYAEPTPSQPTDTGTTIAAPAAPAAPDVTAGASCPVATQDVSTNLKNRQNAINKANYGPQNPATPNRTFWMAKANIFGNTVAEAKTSRCGNCAAFNQTTKILDCIDQGLAQGGSGSQDAWDTIKAGDLGYCEMWDFKCAAARTCDAWVAGGPVTDSTNSTPTKGY